MNCSFALGQAKLSNKALVKLSVPGHHKLSCLAKARQLLRSNHEQVRDVNSILRTALIHNKRSVLTADVHVVKAEAQNYRSCGEWQAFDLPANSLDKAIGHSRVILWPHLSELSNLDIATR